jgi:hypothetical protein
MENLVPFKKIITSRYSSVDIETKLWAGWRWYYLEGWRPDNALASYYRGSILGWGSDSTDVNFHNIPQFHEIVSKVPRFGHENFLQIIYNSLFNYPSIDDTVTI